MNISIRIGREGNEALEKKFVTEAAREGMIHLNGHRYRILLISHINQREYAVFSVCLCPSVYEQESSNTHNLMQFLLRDAIVSAVFAVARCPTVRWWIVPRRLKISSNFLGPVAPSF